MTEPSWFDPKINIGTVLHLFVLVVTMVGIYWKLRELVFKLHHDNLRRLGEVASSVRAMEAKVDSLWEWFTTRLERRHADR